MHRDDMFLYESLEQQGIIFSEPVPSPSYSIDHFLAHDMSFDLEMGPKNFLRTIHSPGHTPGSCCFYSEYFDEPLLFSGDTLFRGSIGRVDLPGGNGEDIFKSIKSHILTLPEETEVIAGHGPTTLIGLEKKHNPFVGTRP